MKKLEKRMLGIAKDYLEIYSETESDIDLMKLQGCMEVAEKLDVMITWSRNEKGYAVVIYPYTTNETYYYVGGGK